MTFEYYKPIISDSFQIDNYDIKVIIMGCTMAFESTDKEFVNSLPHIDTNVKKLFFDILDYLRSKLHAKSFFCVLNVVKSFYS